MCATSPAPSVELHSAIAYAVFNANVQELSGIVLEFRSCYWHREERNLGTHVFFVRHDRSGSESCLRRHNPKYRPMQTDSWTFKNILCIVLRLGADDLEASVRYAVLNTNAQAWSGVLI